MRASAATLVATSFSVLVTASQFPARDFAQNKATHLNSRQLNSTLLNSTSTSLNACSAVSALAASQSGDEKEVPAQVAYDCLQSVPLSKDNATRMINSFQQFFEFQSTTAYNKNPPSSYQMPAVDALVTFDQIRDNVTSGVYHGEYDFQVALYKLVRAIHDDHLEYIPDLVADAFVFTRPLRLASFSSDGISLPKLFVVDDPSANASALSIINGQPANDFLEHLSQYETGQDPDTNYNRLMQILSAGDETGSFAKSPLFSGANTTLGFENGTTAIIANKAKVKADFSSISDGEDLYSRVCAPKYIADDDSDDSDDDGDGKGVAPLLGGYPSPIVRESRNTITGYHLNGSYADTAVLAMSGFSNGKEFQSVVTDFLVKSKDAGKTKLIIDIQSNGGGDEDPEYDLFGQLFPTHTVYEASAWRASNVFKAIDQSMDGLRQSSLNLSSDNQKFIATSPFNFRQEISVDSTNFGSFDEYYGPFTFNGDNFTSAAQANLSTPVGGRQQGIDITGYNARKPNISTQVFATEDIIVLTNGDCSSMCSSFIEQTRTGLGLKFLAVGGRPKYGKMQASGGTRGGGQLDFGDVNSTIAQLQSILATSPSKLQILNEGIGKFDPYAMSRAGNNSGPGINNRNTYRQNDTTGLPTQFRYDPADCRIFYTREDLTNMTNLWARVADVAFGGGRVCSPTGAMNATQNAGLQKRWIG